MTIRAERDPRFYLRFLLIGLAAIGFSLYCLYDGFIGYPRAQERALAFEKLLEEKRSDEWDAYATERGWSTTPPAAPKSHEEFEIDVKTQFWMAGGTALIGIVPLVAVWRSRGRWIELNQQGLTSSWGQTVVLDQVTALEKRQWRNKGIARLRYNDGGRTRTFVIDDFKFKRKPTDEILAEIEQQIGFDKISGGPPEGFEPEVAAAEAGAEAAEG